MCRYARNSLGANTRAGLTVSMQMLMRYETSFRFGAVPGPFRAIHAHKLSLTRTLLNRLFGYLVGNHRRQVFYHLGVLILGDLSLTIKSNRN